MQFPFNLNYYSKFNRSKDKKPLGSLRSLHPLGSSLNQQGYLLNLEKIKGRNLAQNGKRNVEKENQFLCEKNQEGEIIQRKKYYNEVIAASYFQQEDSQQKQQEQPINMPNQKTSLSRFQSEEQLQLFKQSQEQSSIQFRDINQQSHQISISTIKQLQVNSKQLHQVFLQIPAENESFQQDFTQIQSIVLDRLLVFDGYHQYSMTIEDREPKNTAQQFFQYKTVGEQQIPAIPLAQQSSLSQISKIQTQMNDFQDQQHPDIVSHCNSFLHQDDFQIQQKSKTEVFAVEIKKDETIKDNFLQIVQSPISMLVKQIRRELTLNLFFKEIDQLYKNNELLAGFFQQN